MAIWHAVAADQDGCCCPTHQMVSDVYSDTGVYFEIGDIYDRSDIGSSGVGEMGVSTFLFLGYPWPS